MFKRTISGQSLGPVSRRGGADTQWNTDWRVSVGSGALTGLTLLFVSTPFEFVKIRMQLDNVGERLHKNSVACVRHLVRHHGWTVLFRGNCVNAVREVAFCAAYFGIYEYCRSVFSTANWLRPYTNVDSMLYTNVTIGFSGAVRCVVVTLPALTLASL